MVEVNCETDFVARNDGLRGVRRRSWRSSSLERNPADLPRSPRWPLDGGTVEARGRRWCRRSARTSRSAASSRRDGAGQARAVPARRRAHRRDRGVRRRRRAGSARTSRCTSRRRHADSDAPHLRVARPGAGGSVERERAIYAAQAAETGQACRHRRQDGRRRGSTKFLAEVTLLGQPFVKDPDQTVEQYLKSQGAHGRRASSCTSSAKASTRKRMTLPPRWRRWRDA